MRQREALSLGEALAPGESQTQICGSQVLAFHCRLIRRAAARRYPVYLPVISHSGHRELATAGASGTSGQRPVAGDVVVAVHGAGEGQCVSARVPGKHRHAKLTGNVSVEVAAEGEGSRGGLARNEAGRISREVQVVDGQSAGASGRRQRGGEVEGLTVVVPGQAGTPVSIDVAALAAVTAACEDKTQSQQ